MCATCGCDQPGGVTITRANPDQLHFTPVQPTPVFHHVHVNMNPDSRIVTVEQDILSKNDAQAAHNRGHFREQQILAINLVSSPGSGKTALLERTLVDLKGKYSFYVIEGDQQTMNDANRIAATGAAAVQINTGKGCHLDADMIHRALHQLSPADYAILFIENVGNLVCPAMFDLGEEVRAAIISVTEGDDKPLKYPDMFASSQLCVINKIDLLPYVNFKVGRAKEYARRVNPNIQFIELSATTGLGMGEWYRWLEQRHVAMQAKEVLV